MGRSSGSPCVFFRHCWCWILHWLEMSHVGSLGKCVRRLCLADASHNFFGFFRVRFTTGDGGSGIVIVRYATAAFETIANLTLQSTDTTAAAVPTKADMIILMEDSTGTATINTDIKGFVSRDSGSNFTEGTLVNEGSWGTNKKILAFHDLDISGQPSGTSMCYKITTHNQSAGSKQTHIHATSIGWK